MGQKLHADAVFDRPMQRSADTRATHRHLDDRPVPAHSPAAGEVRLFDDRLTTDPAAGTLADATGTVGALVVFTGLVRADPLDGDDRTVALDFEAYPEMATAELERIRNEALDRFDIEGATIHHRIGKVAVGEPIVVVAAAAAHRQAAFDAAAWTMDEVKRRVPLWKQEIGASGTRRWVPGDACGNPVE